MSAKESISADSGSLSAAVRKGRFIRSGDTSHTDHLLPDAIAGAKAGDWEAIHFLYVRFSDEVYRFVLTFVHNTHEAEDITQNVFAKLMQAIKKYEPREVPFAAWLLRVARNASLDHMRKQRQIPCEEVYASDEGHEQLGFERGRSLRDAFQRLPEEQREVVLLRHVKGLSPVEIAAALDKTEGAVHGLHHRGRGALRASLEELGATPVTASPRAFAATG